MPPLHQTLAPSGAATAAAGALGRTVLEAQMRLLAPVAVYAGTVERPTVTLMIHPDVTPAQREKITGFGGLRWSPRAIIDHPVHGVLRGGYTTATAPDWSLLDQCVHFSFGVVANTPPSELRWPLVTAGQDSSVVDIWPRLAGRELVAPHVPTGAVWQVERGCWTASAADVLGVGGPPPGFLLSAGVSTHEAAPFAMFTPSPPSPAPAMPADEAPGHDLGVDARVVASVASAVSVEDAGAAYDELLGAVGEIPDWFGMELRPYQETAAIALVAGRRLLADEPGTGKTVMSLAAAAIMGVERVIIASPSIALSHWEREVRRTGLIDHMGEGAGIVRISAGRKQRPLPERGIVIVTPTLLRDRAALRAEAAEWSADLLIYDEAHSSMNWDSKVSRAMREVAASCDSAFALTGTPVFAAADQIAPLLEITGTLGPIFGGYDEFRARFMRQISFQTKPTKKGQRPRTVHKWTNRAGATDELRDQLDTHCWIRRTKAQVQADMPPKVRSALLVDVKPSELVDAHTKVLATIDEWLDEWLVDHHGEFPDSDDAEGYAAGNLGLSSPLREATGIAKIPAAVEYIENWAAGTERDIGGKWVRPLIVWAHHNVVLDQMSDELEKRDLPFAKIAGGVSPTKIGEIVDEFQDGTWPVILCSIHGAGTGITLTRSSDVLFVETDWTNALVSQAESRAHRFGQNRSVLIATMVAPGTLDVSIQAVLRAKAKYLRALTPTADVDVAVIGPREKLDSPTPEIESIKSPVDVVLALVQEAIAARLAPKKARKPRKVAK